MDAVRRFPHPESTLSKQCMYACLTTFLHRSHRVCMRRKNFTRHAADRIQEMHMDGYNLHRLLDITKRFIETHVPMVNVRTYMFESIRRMVNMGHATEEGKRKVQLPTPAPVPPTPAEAKRSDRTPAVAARMIRGALGAPPRRLAFSPSRSRSTSPTPEVRFFSDTQEEEKEEKEKNENMAALDTYLDGLEDAGEVIDLLSEEEGEETPTRSLTLTELAEWLDTEGLRTLPSDCEEIESVEYFIVDRPLLPSGVWYRIGGDYLRKHIDDDEWLLDNPHIWALDIEDTDDFVNFDDYEPRVLSFDKRYNFSDVDAGQGKVHVQDSQFAGIELTHYIESMRSLEWYNAWNGRSGVMWIPSRVVQWRMVATRKADGTYVCME